MSLNPNAVIVAKRLQKFGHTKGQIAGVLGNFQLESGFNPRVNEGGTVGAPLGEGGFGMGQWTGARQKSLINFAKQKKMDPGDPNLQAEFLVYELSGPEKGANTSLMGAVSPEESARRFLTDYERAGVPKAKQRQEAARKIYGQLSFLDQPQTTITAATSPGIDQRSVTDILSSTLGLQSKPDFDDKKTLADNLKDSFKKSILQQIVSPLSGFQLPSLFGTSLPF